MKVFVIGVSGGTGSRVARALKRQQDVVSGLYRHHDDLTAIQRMGATGSFGDIATMSDQDLATAIKGNDAIVFTAGAGEQDDESMIDVVDEGGVRKTIAAAHLAGIARLLLVSVFPEAWRERNLGEAFEHYMLAKKRADVDLVHSDLSWIILRPSALKDDPGTGLVNLGLAEIHETISRDDLAETIVALLHSPRVSKKILEVTAGSSPIADAVAHLSE